jgi:hypothetical protein
VRTCIDQGTIECPFLPWPCEVFWAVDFSQNRSFETLDCWVSLRIAKEWGSVEIYEIILWDHVLVYSILFLSHIFLFFFFFFLNFIWVQFQLPENGKFR